MCKQSVRHISTITVNARIDAPGAYLICLFEGGAYFDYQFFASKWHHLFSLTYILGDISIKETRSKPVRLWRTFKFWTITNVIFIKSTVYVSYIVPSTEPRFFSGEGWGALIWKGRRFQILSLRRGANSKRGAYLNLGTNSSINGKYYWSIGHFSCCWCFVFNLIFALFLFLFISHYVE